MLAVATTGAMWEVRQPEDDEYELLNLAEQNRTKDTSDSDAKAISSVKLETESYQSTSRLIVYLFTFITAVFLVLTSAALGSSIASNKKAKFNISNILPSVGIQSGDCDTLKYVNLTFHLLINCLGTIIIGCSNYLQQSNCPVSPSLTVVCTSPTFNDIQYEMKTYGDVPFGCNSPTALFRRGQSSVIIIWMIFVVTSLPIHLFLNGITGYSIQAYPVSGQVLSFQDPSYSLLINETLQYAHLWAPAQINITDCATYLADAENWVTEFSNITIVVQQDSEVPKYQNFINLWNSASGETEGPPTPDELHTCYLQQSHPICSVTVRWFPLVVATIAMLIKTITAFLALRNSHHFKYRLYNSLGDFIAVATRHREELSVPEECLANKGEYKKQKLRSLRGGSGGIPKRAEYARHFWIQYLDVWDYLIWLFWVGSIVIISIFLNKSLDVVKNDFRGEDSETITNIFDLFAIAGFGKVSLSFIISNSGGQTAVQGGGAVGLPLQIALANAPQLWLSICYLLWNNQITRIWGEHEWRSYSGRRKPPRVSYGTNVPGLRNTRWLQLPYGLSLVIMIISTTMHWIVSQTLFVIEVENQSGLPVQNGVPSPDAIIFTICYSPTAIFVIAVLAGIVILGMTMYYITPFRSWMPFMGGSARVVFASCTALPKDLPEDGIMWGDVSDEWGRLAGFAENARGLQAREIYPMRYRKPTTETTAKPPFAARTHTMSSQRSKVSYDAETYSNVSRASSIYPPSYKAMPRLGELRYPEPSSPTYPERKTSRSTSFSTEPSGLVYPDMYDASPVAGADHIGKTRSPTARTIPTISEGNRETLNVATSPTDLEPVAVRVGRVYQSPQTSRPTRNNGMGAGYGEYTGSRSDLSSDLEPINTEEQLMYTSPQPLEDDSDEEPEWKGWGVNPVENGNDDHSEMGKEDEERWRGWGQ